MARIAISLTAKTSMTHIPLAVLGYAWRRAGVLQSLQEVTVPIKTVTHTPSEKVLEALVLILAGGRATVQADLRLRPNRLLAHAWGQAQFAQQSTLAETLDAFAEPSLVQLRAAFAAMLGQWSASRAHDFRTGPLWIDADLTGLPASRRAAGSTKGYFAGEKTAPGGNWPG
jgi:hypothetical protein